MVILIFNDVAYLTVVHTPSSSQKEKAKNIRRSRRPTARAGWFKVWKLALCRVGLFRGIYLVVVASTISTNLLPFGGVVVRVVVVVRCGRS